MGSVHCYLAIENLNLTAGQKADYWARIAALGNNTSSDPSCRNHSVTSGVKTIFEAEFTDEEISVAGLTSLLALTLAVDAATISAAVRETDQGIRITLTESAQDKIQVDAFGYSAQGAGWPTKLQSNAQALAYMKAAWGGGVPVSGVPCCDPDWSISVVDWWETHPLNPNAPYPVEIISPTTEIDVEVDHNGDLQAAIDAVPAGGASLILGAVYYNDVYAITAQSNVHFIGQAGSKIKSLYIFPEGTFGSNYGDWSSAIRVEDDPNHAAALAIYADLPRNYYFSDITFDGNAEPLTVVANNPFGMACAFMGVRDILFDRCTFENYSLKVPAGHWGPVDAHGIINNLFFRDCVFSPPGYHAVYCDGTHGGGFVNCTFTARFVNDPMKYMTNNDFTEDFDGDGILAEKEMRNSAYIVAVDNEYTTDGGGSLLSCVGSHVLIQDNTVNGQLTWIGSFYSYAATEGAAYEFRDISIIRNSIGNCQYVCLMDATAGLELVPPRIAGTLGGALISGNAVTNPTSFYKGWLNAVGASIPENVVAGDNVLG